MKGSFLQEGEFKGILAKNQLNALVAQQVNKTRKPSANQKAYPAVCVNNDAQFRLSWHSAHVLQPSLPPLYPQQKIRLYGIHPENDSIQHECSGESRLFQVAIGNEQAFAVAETASDCS